MNQRVAYFCNPSAGVPRLLLGVCLLLVVASGCQSAFTSSTKKSSGWSMSKLNPWKSTKPAPPQQPTRIVSTWTDTVLRQPGKPPMRGFGGRLMFFNRDSDDPIRVDGQLVIYAFDESGREKHETQPSKRYVFTPEEVAVRESESKLGPSYSVWLPWDPEGGETKQISLIARFEPKKGPMVAGEQTRHLLPGAEMPGMEVQINKNSITSGVRPAHHNVPHDAQIPSMVQRTSAEEESVEQQSQMVRTQSRVSTTSIELPDSWKQRLASPKPAKTGVETVSGGGYRNGVGTATPQSIGTQSGR